MGGWCVPTGRVNAATSPLSAPSTSREDILAELPPDALVKKRCREAIEATPASWGPPPVFVHHGRLYGGYGPRR